MATAADDALVAALQSWDGDAARRALLAGANPLQIPHCLRDACWLNDADVVQRLIRLGADPNAATSPRSLQVAARTGHPGVVVTLLNAGADPNQGDGVSTPLADAIAGRHDTCASLLLQRGARPAADETLLVEAAFQGLGATVAALLAVGADPGERHSIDPVARCQGQRLQQRLREGGPSQRPAAMLKRLEAYSQASASADLHYHQATALIVAAGEGHAAVVKTLLAAGVDPNAQDDAGLTALAAARREGRATISALLRAAGARPSTTFSPIERLFQAIDAGQVETVTDLLGGVVAVNVADPRPASAGQTPLLAAVRNGASTTLITRLLAAGAEVNVRSAPPGPLLIHEGCPGPVQLRQLYPQGGFSPLMLAALRGDSAVVKQLLWAGADGEMVANTGHRALHLAAGNGHQASVEALLAAGVTVDIRTPYQETALLLACRHGHLAVVETLLAAGADVDAVDHEGHRPLSLAVLHGQAAILAQLLNAGANPHYQDAEGRDALALAQDQRRLGLNPLGDDDLARLATAYQESDWLVTMIPVTTGASIDPSSVSAERLIDYQPDRIRRYLAVRREQLGFQDLVRELGQRFGNLGKERPAQGGYQFQFPVDRDLDLESLQNEILERGAFVVATQRRLLGVGGFEHLLLLPVVDQLQAVVALGVHGDSTGVTNDRVLAFLLALGEVQPFRLHLLRADTVAGRFLSPVSNPGGLARSMYELCPDIVEQGTGSVEALATRLANRGQLYLWWE